MFQLKITKRVVNIALCVCLPILVFVGVAWAMLQKALPYSDPSILYESAQRMISGDVADFTAADGRLYFYYLRFPFQFGVLLFVELLMRVFGETGLLYAAPVINVLLLVSGYFALVKTTELLFDDPRVTLLTLLFLCALVQPLLGCTLLYGLIPSAALMMWAAYWVVRYCRQDKKRFILYAALICALAVTIKPNALIAVVALSITLIVHAVGKKRFFALAAAVILILAALPGQRLAKAFYEKRLDADYGGGQDYAVWMAMSMRESWMACGWYNMYMYELRDQYGLDIEAYNAQARVDLKARVDTFLSDPDYAYWFFQEKFSSQWNEPTYESIWASAVCDTWGERGSLAKSLVDGRWPGIALEKALNYEMQLYFAGLVLAALALLRRREACRLIFPITILGAVLFHLICEANAKYALAYIPYVCPLAAYGVLTFGKGWLFGKKNSDEASDETRLTNPPVDA